jgi:recombinational DNA repair protein RecR
VHESEHPAVGGDLEYADERTLGRALEGRRDVEG